MIVASQPAMAIPKAGCLVMVRDRARGCARSAFADMLLELPKTLFAFLQSLLRSLSLSGQGTTTRPRDAR